MGRMSVVCDADVLVVGAGPAGAAAAIHAADAGLDVLLVDAATFPRDKTCGDGLTPRAIHQLGRLGLAEEVTRDYHNKGLKLRGFGGSVTAPWPDGHYGTLGSAMPRTEFDHLIVRTAVERGATLWEDATATAVRREGRRMGEVTVRHGGVEKQVRARWVLVADGVRSTFGKLLGREWHRGEVYGIAARSYCTSPMSTEPWIHSDVELLDADGTVQPGYGWIFPLGDGRVNLGAGALSTDARPAKVNTKKLLSHYAAQKREEWQLGPEQDVTSAMLPMGGAVSNVAGPNWMLIGDSAALVNPLNGEGIDYGMESAEMAVDLLVDAGHAPSFIDLGGGVPMSYLDDPAQWRDYHAARRAVLDGYAPPFTWKADPLHTVYPFHQSPVRGEWLREVLADGVAEMLLERGLRLHLEPGRSLLDGCGMILAEVAFVKERSDGLPLVGLAMNRTQCRTTSDDYLVDPLHVTDAPDGEEIEAYLVGAYCIEDELILRRRIRFPRGVRPGDTIALPNTAGYFMHILESASHQIPLAKNVVWPGTLDDIDA